MSISLDLSDASGDSFVRHLLLRRSMRVLIDCLVHQVGLPHAQTVSATVPLADPGRHGQSPESLWARQLAVSPLHGLPSRPYERRRGDVPAGRREASVRIHTDVSESPRWHESTSNRRKERARKHKVVAEMPEIRWRDDESTERCMVCGSTESRLIAEVDAHFLTTRVARCAVCDSLVLGGPMHAYTPDNTSIDDYIEGGAGIDAIFEGLCRVRSTSVTRFLDVGCNYGFGVHLAKRVFGWEALGVEPSPAGRRGHAELAVEIRDDLIGETTDLGGPFDLILASEVVEHVTDPVGFLTQLRRRITSSGVMVLTTPAAEVMTMPVEREEAAIQALSPGNHYFLASVSGMNLLLDEAGFSHHRVVRQGATLQVVAAVSAEGFATVVEHPVPDQAALLRYLDETADAAPHGSALASGMASRHFRACVMRGAFPAAEKSAIRLRNEMLARSGFDLEDPHSCITELHLGRRPVWFLAGAAYSKGIFELIGQQNPVRALDFFDLATVAALAWRETSGVLDLDVWNLRELSLGHRCLALAACDPESAGPATDRLTEVLDMNSTDDALRIAWWKTRTFNELVARGHLWVKGDLVTEVELSVDKLIWSSDLTFRQAGLDALFCQGIRALNTGLPTVARSWFIRCFRACDQMPAADSHAIELAAKARLHDSIAADQGGSESRRI